MQDKKKVIQQLIGRGKTKEAIEALSAEAKNTAYNDLMILQAKYEKLKRNNSLNLSSREEISLEHNQVNNSLLELTDLVFNPENDSENNLSKNIKEQSHQKEKINPKLIGKFVIPVIILALLAIAAKTSGYEWNQIFNSDKTSSNTLLIKVKTKNGLKLPPKGKVYLTYGNAQIGKEINNHQEAIFTEVPNEYFKKNNFVKISFNDPLGEPYYSITEDSLYQLQFNQNIDVLVDLKGLNKLYGVVKDYTNGDFIEGARVSVLNLETFTDKNGWWELQINEEDKKRKFHTIRASKEEYQNWEQSNVPAQIEQEISILLKRR